MTIGLILSAFLFDPQIAPNDPGNPPVFTRGMEVPTTWSTTTEYDCRGNPVRVSIAQDEDGVRLTGFSPRGVELPPERLAQASSWLSELQTHTSQELRCAGTFQMIFRVRGTAKSDGRAIERGIVWDQGRLIYYPTPERIEPRGRR